MTFALGIAAGRALMAWAVKEMRDAQNQLYQAEKRYSKVYNASLQKDAEANRLADKLAEIKRIIEQPEEVPE